MAKDIIDFRIFSSVSLKQNPFEDDTPVYQTLSALVKKYQKNIGFYKMHFEFKNINVNVYDNFIFFSYNMFGMFDPVWTNLEMICRPIVFDIRDGEIVARGMNKFFNYNEVDSTKLENIQKFVADPSINIEVGEKLDGTLILVWKYKNRIYASSKGAMNTVQGEWAYKHFMRNYSSDLVPDGVTLFFEAIYPDNRLDSQLVIDYKNMQGLFFIGARNNYGNEFSYSNNRQMADVAAYQMINYQKIDNLLEFLEQSTKETNTEGYVISFYNLQGKVLRIKNKTDWYKEMKRLYNNLSFDTIRGKIQNNQEKEFLESNPDPTFKTKLEAAIDKINAFVDNKCTIAEQYFDEIIYKLEHTDYYSTQNEDAFVTFHGIDIKSLDFKKKDELTKKIKRFFARTVNQSSIYGDKKYAALLFMLLNKQNIRPYVLEKMKKQDIQDEDLENDQQTITDAKELSMEEYVGR